MRSEKWRFRLTVKGNILGRKQLAQVGTLFPPTLFPPETILGSYCQLVVQTGDDSDRKEMKSGQPGTREVIAGLAMIGRIISASEFPGHRHQAPAAHTYRVSQLSVFALDILGPSKARLSWRGNNVTA